MIESPATDPMLIAADAMCGGVARWLRVFGVDTTYTPGIADAVLVQHALDEQRVLVSSDQKLFERRLFTSGRLPGLLMPVGLRLEDQVRFVMGRLALPIGFPRCALCNGELVAVARGDVADVVPARSLVWAREFFRCQTCGHVFWEGTHWRRIGAVRDSLLGSQPGPPQSRSDEA